MADSFVPLRLPTVSIVITYHNEGDLLQRAIDSVESQTYEGPLDVVVVDDASTAPPRIRSGGRREVRLVRSSRNIFLPAARNLGVKACAGDMVGFLDADDEYLDTKVEDHVRFLLRHPEAVLVGGQHYVHRERVWLQVPGCIEAAFPHLCDQETLLPAEIAHELCLHYCFTSGSTTVRRGAFESVGGFDESCDRWGEDWDFLVRIAQAGRLGYVPRPAQRYLCRAGSMTSTLNPEKFVNAARTFEKWGRTIQGLPRAYRRALRNRQREQWLLAAQVYHEDQGKSDAGLRCALAALRRGPSVWAIRSVVRMALHAQLARWRPTPAETL